LIVPAFVGGMLAYICRPFVARLERYRIPRGVGVGALLLVFVAVALVGVNSVRAAIPNETAVLELRVRALYARHHRYRTLMGLDASWSQGNRFYGLAHGELDPLMDRLSVALALTADERPRFLISRERGTDAAAARSRRLLDYEQANTHALETRARRAGDTEPAMKRPGGSPSTPAPFSVTESGVVRLGDIVASWAIAPLIFLFLLVDTGSLKRGLLTAVPNRLFEPALAVLADIDEALGNYVRGIFLEGCALGVTGSWPRWRSPSCSQTSSTNRSCSAAPSSCIRWWSSWGSWEAPPCSERPGCCWRFQPSRSSTRS
jgi:hypothetical protein